MPASNTCVKTGQGTVAMATIPYPDEPGPGQALIRTTLSTVCGSDIHIVDEMPLPPGVPMGHEAIGVVEAVGAGVTGVKPGDRVVTGCLICCGTCRRCLEGDHQVCETYNAPGNLLFGAQGEFFLVNGAQTSMAKIPASLSDEQVNDVTWIGSSYFLDTAGFYDTYRSRSPRVAWPYDDVRDAGLAEVGNGGGYPNCRQWWLDGGDGLRDRLLAQVDPSLLSRFAQWAGFLSQAQVDDSVIRAIASPRHQVMNQGHVYTDYGGQIGGSLPNVVTRAASDVGLTIGSLGFFPAMDVVRQSLPMILSFLKMALVICIPLVLVFGTYDLRTLVTASCVQFALFFTDFWFQLARWIDSTILNALYGWHSPHSNFNPLMGLNNAFGDMLLNFVMAMMFIVLPGFWVIALSWAGVRAGNILGGLTLASGDAKSAGGSGARVAMTVASKGLAK